MPFHMVALDVKGCEAELVCGVQGTVRGGSRKIRGQCEVLTMGREDEASDESFVLETRVARAWASHVTTASQVILACRAGVEVGNCR